MENYLIIDTETTGEITKPLCYDVGYAICNEKGEIFERKSFVVAEVFIDLKEMMAEAFYSAKIPQYWEDIKNGKRTIKTLWNIRKEILADMKKYKVKKVGAYNINFDKRALNNSLRYCTKSSVRWFFPFGTDYFCIWGMACNSLMNTKTFVEFAVKNGLVSDSDNLVTSAESCYKYITNKVDFIESHTALEDVEIEVDIFAKCMEIDKTLLELKPNPSCWRIPQRKRKEIDLEETFTERG